jgi:hypothetical protein
MRILWLALIVALTFAHLFQCYSSFARVGKILEAKSDLRRLARAVLHISGGRASSEKSFWVTVGRTEPMRDPWGQDYLFEPAPKMAGGRQRWRSAGPDRSYGTEDDLEHPVPSAEELKLPESSAGSPGMMGIDGR